MDCYLNVVSLRKHIFSGLINSIQVSGMEGQLGIFPGHSPLLSLLKPGTLLIKNKNDEKDFIYISGGIIEVQPTEINIAVNVAISGVDLNKDLILQTKTDLERQIKNSSFNNKQIILDKLSLELAKLHVIETMIKNS